MLNAEKEWARTRRRNAEVYQQSAIQRYGRLAGRPVAAILLAACTATAPLATQPADPAPAPAIAASPSASPTLVPAGTPTATPAAPHREVIVFLASARRLAARQYSGTWRAADVRSRRRPRWPA